MTIRFHLSVWLCIKLVLEIQKCPASRRWCCSTSAAGCLPTGMYVQVSNSDENLIFHCDSSEMHEPPSLTHTYFSPLPWNPLIFLKPENFKIKREHKYCHSINVGINKDEYQVMRCKIKLLILDLAQTKFEFSSAVSVELLLKVQFCSWSFCLSWSHFSNI